MLKNQWVCDQLADDFEFELCFFKACFTLQKMILMKWILIKFYVINPIFSEALTITRVAGNARIMKSENHQTAQ